MAAGAIASGFPHRELDLHRRARQDAAFAEALADYELARKALAHWRSQGPSKSALAAEYATLVREMEEDLVTRLETPSPSPD